MNTDKDYYKVISESLATFVGKTVTAVEFDHEYGSATFTFSDDTFVCFPADDACCSTKE